MSTYVVGDIHGCFSLWMKLKKQIESTDDNARFILVGDIIDRGPETFEMINWALANITSDGKYQMIMGNHEEEKLRWFKSFKEAHYLTTYKDYRSDYYDFQKTMMEHEVNDEQLAKIIDWFSQLSIYKEIMINNKRFIIVHASFPNGCRNKDESFKKRSIHKNYVGINNFFDYRQRNLRDIIWNRDYIGYSDLKNTTVIHGHTPTLGQYVQLFKCQPGRIFKVDNEINVDCGAVFKDRFAFAHLAAICLEDLKEYYV